MIELSSEARVALDLRGGPTPVDRRLQHPSAPLGPCRGHPGRGPWENPGGAQVLSSSKVLGVSIWRAHDPAM